MNHLLVVIVILLAYFQYSNGFVQKLQLSSLQPTFISSPVNRNANVFFSSRSEYDYALIFDCDGKKTFKKYLTYGRA